MQDSTTALQDSTTVQRSTKVIAAVRSWVLLYSLRAPAPHSEEYGFTYSSCCSAKGDRNWKKDKMEKKVEIKNHKLS